MTCRSPNGGCGFGTPPGQIDRAGCRWGPQPLDGAGGGFSEQGFQFGKDLLNGALVGIIGRQVAQRGPAGLDRGLDTGHFVGPEVVHDHDVAGAKRRREHLLDPGAKDGPVDWPVEHERRGQPVAPQGAQERGGVPVARGNASPTMHAFRGAAARGGHGGRGPGFIQKYQATDFQVRLFGRPSLPRLGYVRALLFGRMEGLFFRRNPRRATVFHIVVMLTRIPCSATPIGTVASRSGRSWP